VRHGEPQRPRPPDDVVTHVRRSTSPNTSIQPQFRTIDGLKIRFAEGEQGDEHALSKLDLIDAGHFTWEDAPEEYAEIVTSWWAGGHAEA